MRRGRQEWWETSPTAMSGNIECRGNIWGVRRRENNLFTIVKKTKDLRAGEKCSGQ